MRFPPSPLQGSLASSHSLACVVAVESPKRTCVVGVVFVPLKAIPEGNPYSGKHPGQASKTHGLVALSDGPLWSRIVGKVSLSYRSPGVVKGHQ